MIQNSFSFIDGISQNTELKIKEAGIQNWNDFLEQHHELNCLPQSKLDKIKAELFFAKEAHENNDLEYFKQRVPDKEHWKLKDMGKIAYVDIETTGLSRWSHEITTIGIYDGVEPKVYIQGQDLQEAYDKLDEFDIVVTFNGKTFDMPFIEHHGKRKYDLIHLDLRFLLKELGFSGGLKKIELELGITRPDELEGVDGYEAVRLWRKYKQGNLLALEKLVKYNIQDIVNLKDLLEYYVTQKNLNLHIINL
jgi:uncharacterized protein YprB with RNaseH-like and TPR domain